MSSSGTPVDLSVLKGKVAVVTGAANFGIGYGIAAHCAEKLGMHVAIVDLVEHLAQQAAAQLASNAGGNVRAVGIAADVTQPENMQRCLEQVQSNFAGIPIGAVFANAGVIFAGKESVLRGTLDAWDTTMAVNVRGVLVTLRTFVPVLQAQDTNSIVVTTASTAAYFYGGGAYGVSKHACLAMTESLSDEISQSKHADKISVHVLCPSIVGTNLLSTTNRNKLVAEGKAQPWKEATKPPEFFYGMAMTPEKHAQQVFDRIARGEFYLVTENERPYVDHDFPLGAKNNFKERSDGMLSGHIVPPKKRYQAPLMVENVRRMKEEGKTGDFLSGAGRSDRQAKPKL